MLKNKHLVLCSFYRKKFVIASTNSPLRQVHGKTLLTDLFSEMLLKDWGRVAASTFPSKTFLCLEHVDE